MQRCRRVVIGVSGSEELPGTTKHHFILSGSVNPDLVYRAAPTQCISRTWGGGRAEPLSLMSADSCGLSSATSAGRQTPAQEAAQRSIRSPGAKVVMPPQVSSSILQKRHESAASVAMHARHGSRHPVKSVLLEDIADVAVTYVGRSINESSLQATSQDPKHPIPPVTLQKCPKGYIVGRNAVWTVLVAQLPTAYVVLATSMQGVIASRECVFRLGTTVLAPQHPAFCLVVPSSVLPTTLHPCEKCCWCA